MKRCERDDGRKEKGEVEQERVDKGGDCAVTWYNAVRLSKRGKVCVTNSGAMA